MDCFEKLEALVDGADAGAIEEANALLARFRDRSEQTKRAIEEFMLDFKTLVFVVETGEEGFQKPIRKLARARLAKLKHLVSQTA
ncbi:hypothetical protein [Mesorhizobium sp. B2-3-12]|uniref:hypothetical protein n=1 Tax=Mesorhizobium sp. B2-3-12 TaxID=2589952 RepID=UPI001FEF001B|nr:hypothetical protein [Mesorhizobium sp. B2-3-12]